jgi:hypothetical protein
MIIYGHLEILVPVVADCFRHPVYEHMNAWVAQLAIPVCPMLVDWLCCKRIPTACENTWQVGIITL